MAFFLRLSQERIQSLLVEKLIGRGYKHATADDGRTTRGSGDMIANKPKII